MSVAEQEFRRAVAGSEDVLGLVLADAHQVAHDLLIGDAHRGELAGAIEPAERSCVALVGLHALAWPFGNERRGDHAAVHTERAELALQRIPGRSRLTAARSVVGSPQQRNCLRTASGVRIVLP